MITKMARSPNRKVKPAPNELDRLVGRNVRRLRLCANLSMKALAERLGLVHQAIFCIEHGKIRLYACYLPVLAEALNVSIDEFFLATDDLVMPADAPDRSKGYGLLRAFAGITNEDQKQAVLALSRALAEASIQLRQTSAGTRSEDATAPPSPRVVDVP